jgi:hypothetical protein
MSRFHFHTEDGVCIADKRGIELADLEAAKRTAVQVLVEALHKRPQAFWETEAFRVIVSDHRGLNLFVLELSATMAAVASPSARAAQAAKPD